MRECVVYAGAGKHQRSLVYLPEKLAFFSIMEAPWNTPYLTTLSYWGGPSIGSLLCPERSRTAHASFCSVYVGTHTFWCVRTHTHTHMYTRTRGASTGATITLRHVTPRLWHRRGESGRYMCIYIIIYICILYRQWQAKSLTVMMLKIKVRSPKNVIFKVNI